MPDSLMEDELWKRVEIEHYRRKSCVYHVHAEFGTEWIGPWDEYRPMLKELYGRMAPMAPGKLLDKIGERDGGINRVEVFESKIDPKYRLLYVSNPVIGAEKNLDRLAPDGREIRRCRDALVILIKNDS